MKMKDFNFFKETIRLEWNNKNCYIAMQIAEFFNHESASKAINRALKTGNFELTIDYDILAKENLKSFKKLAFERGVYDVKYAPKLVIVYESGVEKFLNYLNGVLGDKIYTQNYYGDNNFDYDERFELGSILTKSFNGKKINTLIWNGEPCWVATDIAEVLGYSDKSRSVIQCITSEEFEKGFDYETLSYQDVKRLFNITGRTPIANGKAINNLTILYREGVMGFINYSHMPIGKEFRKWLRTEVFTELIHNSEVPSYENEKSYPEMVKSDKQNNDLRIKGENLNLAIGLLDRISVVIDNKENEKINHLNNILDKIF